MNRLGHEGGFTLVEVLVTMVITLMVFSAALDALNIFQNESHTNEQRLQVQDMARTTIDRMSLQLRNVAAESPTSAGALERSGPDDIVFQTVYGLSLFGGSNATNQMRVRYCLDTSNPIAGVTPSPSNAVLVMQTQTWTTSTGTTSTGPSVPADGGVCPGPAGSGWNNDPNHPDQIVATNITNDIDGQTRPVFTYAPVGAMRPAQINFVDVDLFLDINPGHEPGETEMKSGIFLRNSFAAPIAAFNQIPSSTGSTESFDASPSTDPNGQALTYQWVIDGSPVSGATTQQWSAPNDVAPFTAGTHTVTVTVTSTGGLSSTAPPLTVTVS
jgi:prepilin-type N-terminal cleavage/methylation domain-containing protein